MKVTVCVKNKAFYYRFNFDNDPCDFVVYINWYYEL